MKRRRGPFAFEHRRDKLAPVRVYRRRLLHSGAVALGIIAFSLAIGVVGYRVFGGLEGWVDCLYNASMILGGMGPVDELKTNAGKVFASLYALYSGVILIASVGVLISPVLHRMLHRFHIEADEAAGD